MDSIAAAKSGHLGLPLGAAEMGAVLFGQSMTFNPDDPQWVNRDRFVLSAGHGSMFLYSWLHLAGFDLSKDEVANFRQHHSMTPGHPEFPNSEHVTPGIEATTGPLGAGVSNCAGLAAASKMSAAIFNTDDHTIFDNHIFCIVGDGCLQEGVSAEAACFSAHEKLDNLIVLYDANDVTLDKMAEFTQSEDVGARYEAYGWDVITLTDGHDLKAIYEAIEEAKANDNGKPTMIIAKTEIGRGIDEVAGTNAAHGEAGVAYVDEARKNLGLPADKWHVSDDTYKFFADRKAAQKSQYDAWQATYKAWQSANPDQAKILQDGIDGKTPSEAELLKAIPKTGFTPLLGEDMVERPPMQGDDDTAYGLFESFLEICELWGWIGPSRFFNAAFSRRSRASSSSSGATTRSCPCASTRSSRARCPAPSTSTCAGAPSRSSSSRTSGARSTATCSSKSSGRPSL